MSYQLKKEHLTNWNAPKSDWRPANINNKPVINYDRDVYIPENSSSPPIVHGKDLSILKAPPGQGTVGPIVETQPSAMDKNYYPYWHYYKLKNPDWMMRHHQNNDGQLIPYDTVDPSQYIEEPAMANTKPKLSRHSRKSHLVTSDASKHRNKNVNDKFTNEDKRHHHQHNYSVSSAKQYVDQEFRAIDNSFKKLERTTYFEGIGNPPIISNQNSYLPSILPRENLSGSKSTDSYTKFTLSKDWRDSIKSPRIYKADPQTKLYDRYFNNVIEKKLTS
ncbi:unnamed protein product [Rotaria socialis]|uniref:Uncharacterized protein n=1 Tax=Rotaria socialis TaxID=392032 RepID=A0A821H804_9BILA|nr:unnamed protein product [Rotaria socialis]CAF4678007.1 unnamed protein product [Rotaria socialis]